MKKRGQQVFGMSFGVIFSIILIIFILVTAGIVISKFWNTKDCVLIKNFKEDLEKEVESAWNAQKTEFDFPEDNRTILPSSIEYVCFANLSEGFKGEYVSIGERYEIYEGSGSNMFLYPPKETCEMLRTSIDHLNIKEITSKNNPYCIPVENGKIDIEINKGYNERLVKLK